jgi:hypothetical protein
MKPAIAVLTLLFALSLMAFAHGKEKHIMGTVTNISANSVTLETTDKKSVTVEVNDKTKFEKSGSPASPKALKIGDKVVIHADQSGVKLVAKEVHFGAMKGRQGMDHK